MSSWGSGSSASICIVGDSYSAGQPGVAYSHDGGATWTGVDVYDQIAGSYPGLQGALAQRHRVHEHHARVGMRRAVCEHGLDLVLGGLRAREQ